KCSKCRQAKALLDERELNYRLIPYLDEPPNRKELAAWFRDLGLEHPRQMMRQKDELYRETGMDRATPEAAFQAMLDHPKLIERPIVRRGQRAVIARPPENLLELLD
ncbi:MAG: ArsC/Spx/MgsR family protein, partial [Planctomycetota bacterium]